MKFNDLDMILGALTERQDSCQETLPFSMGIVLFNIGDRFTHVACVAGEWSGLKGDIPRSEGIPKCPNGHVMTEGKGLKLGWVDAD